MSIFVVDASAALAWFFEDESSALANGLLDRVRQGDQIVVPAHWPTEILNSLLFASRRKRIRLDQPGFIWSQISQLPVEIEPALTGDQGKEVLNLAAGSGLTIYDAAYLELCKRRNLPLGTLDNDLRGAAQKEGIALL